MIKKMVILAVVVAVSVIGAKEIWTYISKVCADVQTEIRDAREKAKDNAPPEEEIARLKTEINLLDKDVKTLVNQLAKERVEVNQLKEKVDVMAEAQSKNKELFNARLDAVEKAEGQVTFGNRSMSVAAAMTELKADKKRLDTAGKSLTAQEALLTNRIKIRDSIEKQLEATKNQKSELAGAVEEMEAELALLKLQQTESKYQTDDTRLSKIKEDLRKLRTKVEIKREELKITETTMDETPAATVTDGQSVKDELKSMRAAVNGPAKKPEGAKAAPQKQSGD